MSSLVSEDFYKPRAYKSVNSSETFLFFEQDSNQNSEQNKKHESDDSGNCEIS